jgi:hypothetical protein
MPVSSETVAAAPRGVKTRHTDTDAPRFTPGADFHICHNDTMGVVASKLPVALAPSLADGSHHDISVMHVNIQGFLSHLAELCAYIRLCVTPPDIVCVNETFLDTSVETIELEDYEIIGRRDRNYSGDKRRCGGVIVFAKATVAGNVTLLLKSDVSERLWMQLHTDTGPYLLCAWYRPPVQGELESIESFGNELDELRRHAIGIVLVGDLNLHSQRWLRYSARNSAEGEAMRQLCSKMGLRQIVRGPTRGDNLLDLVITDIESASVIVDSEIADHAILINYTPQLVNSPICCTLAAGLVVR